MNEDRDKVLQEHLLEENLNISDVSIKGSETVTPYSNAGIFSILTFSWMNPLFATGNKKTLDLEDVPQLSKNDSVFRAFPTFQNIFEAECGTINTLTTFKLVKLLIYSARKEIALVAILASSNSLASYVGPYLINTFVQYLNGEFEFENRGYLLVLAFSVAKLIECLSQRHWFFKFYQVGMRIRALLVTIIYNKGLTLSFQSRQSHTTGEIINFMAVDAERVGDFSLHLVSIWLTLLKVALGLLILYKSLGLAFIAAFVAAVIVMLANIPLGSLQEKFQDKLMKSKDSRMKAISEVLRNMRILKLQAWEMKFLSKITELRKIEEGWLKKFVYSVAMTSFFFEVASVFVSVVAFGTCMLIGVPLDTGKILSALATFQILQGAIYSVPGIISNIIQIKVSLDRIVSFLQLEDLQSNVAEKLPRDSSDRAIEVIDGNFSWDLSSANITLKNINITVLHGMKVAVCGTVGSGKSSLLSCLLGEVPKRSGTIKVCGTEAYVAQSPWIQSGKMEENILFRKKMDREMYDEVLEACSLKKDLEILPFGDQTIIGERGINLSGGQKQRIQIARALYQDADIYLFDDPFSAVDAHTGSHIFKECLLQFLSEKTVIYVTHQVEFLPAADLILVMKDGVISQQGKYTDLLNSGIDLMELVSAHKKALSEFDSLNEGELSNKFSALKQNISEDEVHDIKEKDRTKDVKNDHTDGVAEQKGQLVQGEEREKGRFGFSIYWKYITTAYGGAFAPFIALAQILFQLLQIGSSYWLAWATPISVEAKPVVGVYALMVVYVAWPQGVLFASFSKKCFL